ncbi:MAG: alkyl sulfatase dimerization domain-containing protein [Promethearchaeota archaeon]
MKEDSTTAMNVLASSEPKISKIMDGVYNAYLPIAGCVWFETGEGTVLIDTLISLPNAKLVAPHIKEEIKYIIYTHGHADHVGGTKAFLSKNTKVIAGKYCPDRFDRYKFLKPYRNIGAAMQFGIPVSAFGDGLDDYVYPTETFEGDMEFKLGDWTFQCHTARAETDDAVWVYIPELKTACIGDLMIGSLFPNIGNPWKPTRFALDWAKELERIRDLNPEYIFCNGGGHIFKGSEGIDALTDNIDVIRSLHDQVVDLINDEVHITEMIHKVKVPEKLANSPYLAQYYSRPEFFVYNVYRWYHGYYDHNPAHLIPRPEKEVLSELNNLIGDSQKILKRSKELLAQGKAQLALEILDVLIQSEPENIDALKLRIELVKNLAKHDKCLMSRNAYVYSIKQDKKNLRALKKKAFKK